jgi:hypothetical protein
MHIVMLIAAGLILLALMVGGAMLIAQGRRTADAARIFIWIWLAASIVNGIIGVTRAGIPVINEIAAFVPIFGVPAIVAWLLARRLRG